MRHAFHTAAGKSVRSAPNPRGRRCRLSDHERPAGRPTTVGCLPRSAASQSPASSAAALRPGPRARAGESRMRGLIVRREFAVPSRWSALNGRVQSPLRVEYWDNSLPKATVTSTPVRRRLLRRVDYSVVEHDEPRRPSKPVGTARRDRTVSEVHGPELKKPEACPAPLTRHSEAFEPHPGAADPPRRAVTHPLRIGTPLKRLTIEISDGRRVLGIQLAVEPST